MVGSRTAQSQRFFCPEAAMRHERHDVPLTQLPTRMKWMERNPVPAISYAKDFKQAILEQPFVSGWDRVNTGISVAFGVISVSGIPSSPCLAGKTVTTVCHPRKDAGWTRQVRTPRGGRCGRTPRQSACRGRPEYPALAEGLNGPSGFFTFVGRDEVVGELIKTWV